MRRHESGSARQALVEQLEGRQLMSATAACTAAPAGASAAAAVMQAVQHRVAFVNVLGIYTGPLTIARGGTGTLTLTFTTQRGGAVKGTFAQAGGLAGNIVGSVNAKRALSLSFKATNARNAHGTVKGSVSADGNTITGTVVTFDRLHRSVAAFTVTRT